MDFYTPYNAIPIDCINIILQLATTGMLSVWLKDEYIPFRKNKSYMDKHCLPL
jgi:hypothetical protein